MVVENITFNQQLRNDRIKLIRNMQAMIDDSEYGILLQNIVGDIRHKPEQYLSYSQDDPLKVSYAQNPQHIYDNNKRVKTTMQRYIRRQLGVTTLQIPDDKLDKLCRPLFASRKIDTTQFQLLSGDDITEAYSRSVGASSCMTGRDSKYVEIYALNPDKVSLVVYDKMARALLWTCDDNIKVLDRIYPNDGVHINIIQEWAKSQGIVYRMGNSCPHGEVELSDNQEHCVTVKYNEYFPYMDTFRYADINENDQTAILYNSRKSRKRGNTLLDNTNGGPLAGGFICESCGDRVSEDDMRCPEYGDGIYCENCFDELYAYCESCSCDVCRDDIVQVDDDYMCRDCAERHATRCDVCGDWTKKECVTTSDTDKTCCHDCIENLTICDDCGEVYERKQYTHVVDNEILCEDCCHKCEYCGDWIKDGNDCEDCEAEDDKQAIAA